MKRNAEETPRRPVRANIRVEVIPRDKEYLQMIADQQGWELNYAMRRVLNTWVESMLSSGEDWGVIPRPPDRPKRERRA